MAAIQEFQMLIDGAWAGASDGGAAGPPEPAAKCRSILVAIAAMIPTLPIFGRIPMTSPLTPTLAAALLPLAAAAERYPGLEGQVVWAEDGGYAFQDDGELGLDPEEIAFYAEGLLAEGFHLTWALLADVDAPDAPLILQLTCAETSSPSPPPLPEGWCLARVPAATGRAEP